MLYKHIKRLLFLNDFFFFSEDGSDWLPKPHDRVCSVHFPDGKPTERFPNPVLRMGHTSSTLINPTRTSSPTRENVGQTSSPSSESESDTIEIKASTINDLVQYNDCSDNNSHYRDKNQVKQSKFCKCEGDICICCVGCLEKSKMIEMLQDQIKRLEEKLNNNGRFYNN